nr:PREDICTED: uncharacterized protein LOC109037032 isoform X1 [Bemisia tabaci]
MGTLSGMLNELQITLPSDKTWRTVNYFKLVEQQRLLNQLKKEAAESGEVIPRAVSPEKASLLGKWVDRDMIASSKRPGLEGGGGGELRLSRHLARISQDTVWTPNELIIGSIILAHQPPDGDPPKATPSSTAARFADERQMRRVFTLLYDVFRYKNILSEVLENVQFFDKHPEYEKECCLVWLLCYDLLKRNFKPRDLKTLMEDKRLAGTQTKAIDDCLWRYRVHLGASVARIRIKNNAIHLSHLLPAHLQDNRLGNTLSPFVSGWINYNKSDLETIIRCLEESGFRHLSAGEDVLTDETFRMDHILPLYISIKPTNKDHFQGLFFTKQNHIVIQDRSFCVGAAMVQNIVKELDVRGSIAQTHINTIRTTCYLANLLAIDDRKEKLLVFASDNKVEEYEDYLSGLGVKNVELHAGSFSGLISDPSNILENVVGVLATPPNTYYGVVDPVDLVCSRGGDLQLLKNLTQGHPQDAHGEALQNINEILQEQQRTLLVAMTKPQIQFIVYETHSQYEKENREMVTRLLNELNAYANEKFGENEKKKVEQKAAEEEERRREAEGLEADEEEDKAQMEDIEIDAQENDGQDRDEKLSPERPASTSENMAPDCDLFEFGLIPDLCDEHENCWRMEDFGLFVAFIKRKEIISLDPQYMIKFAEQRGLFSQVEAMKRQSTQPRKKAENEKSSAGGEREVEHERTPSATIQSLMKQQLTRIAAPTQASVLHAATCQLQGKEQVCSRYSSHANTDALEDEPRAGGSSFLMLRDGRRWWRVVIKLVLRRLREARGGVFARARLRLRRGRDVPLKLARTKELFKKMSTSAPRNRYPYPLHINSIEFAHQPPPLPLRDDFSSCFDLAVPRGSEFGSSLQRCLPVRHSI